MDFRDGRSAKVVFVPHCVLNQNARLAGCAERPAAVTELVTGLMERDLGVVQLPCPELIVIGLDRAHVEIRSALESRPARAACRRMAEDVAYQVRQYLDAGVKVVGILGKNGSPSCGVERTSSSRGFGPGMGVFIEELAAELDERGLDVPLAGTLDAEPQAALALVEEWLKKDG